MVPGEPASSSRISTRFECIVVVVGVGALFTWIGWQCCGGSSCKVSRCSVDAGVVILAVAVELAAEAGIVEGT